MQCFFFPRFLSVGTNSYSSFLLFYLCLVRLIFCVSVARADQDLPVQLAKLYSDDLPVREFLISEKYDGVRAIWRDGRLQTRRGNTIHAPRWFVAKLPDIWLDGELWSKRQDFEFIASTVSKDTPVDEDWKRIRYMVFDAPNDTQTFVQRVERYTSVIRRLGLEYVVPVEQLRVDTNEALTALLEQHTRAGSEGLMLHRADALYQAGRTSHLFKLKPYMDAEALVLAHLPGKGKYQNSLGALKVMWKGEEGKDVVFKVGTGFSDAERARPPPIGSVITFKYHGLTRYGVPRFASFMRIRTKE